MYIKIHSSYRDVVSLCDKELIGKTFKEGKMCLIVRENFFKGEELSKEEIKKQIEKAIIEDSTFNIVGKKSVALALEMGIIEKSGIITIDGVPIALILI